jgi:hypothetical protein
MPAGFEDMMPHQVKVFHSTGVDDYGQKAYANQPAVYNCLFDDSIKITRTSDAELVTVGRTAYIDSQGVPILKDDKIAFSDDSTRPVISVSNHYDTDGTVYAVTVRFQ